MSSTSTIKEFLVRLGYKVDATGERKFIDGVNNATKMVNDLGNALKVIAAGGAAAGVMAWMGKMASSMEGLYYSSQRAGASAKNLQAFGYAASQMGSSVQEAQATVQGFHQWMLNMPGSEMWLHQLGIGTRDSNGKLRDATDLLQDFGKKLATMPTALQNKYAQLLGIPLNLRLALQQGMGGYIEDYRKMLAEAGMDSDKAAKRSHDFMVQVRGLGGAFHILGLSVAAGLMGDQGGGGALDRFRHLLLSHSEQITRIARNIGNVFNNLFERVLNWLDSLDWNKVDNGVKKFLDGLDGLSSSMEILKVAAFALAGALTLGVLRSITSVIDGLGRLIPMLGAGGATGSIRMFGAALAGINMGALAAVLGAAGLAYSPALGGKRRADGSYEDELPRPTSIPGTDTNSLWAKVRGQKSAYLGSSYQAALLLANRYYAAGDQPSQTDLQKQAAAILAGKVSASDMPGHSDPLGIRNNNPGNLRTGAGGAIGAYATPQAGLNALANQLMLYYSGQSRAARHPLTTLRDIISTYAPSSENNTAAYITDLAKKLSVSPDQQLNLRDPTQLQALMRGIVQHENGMNPYSAEMFRAAAGNTAQTRGRPGSITATTNIHVTGNSNPLATAQAVAGQQNSVNQRLFRDFAVPVV
ncbi:hypothetical protein [Rhodanobacter sp. DHG33]|uniref:hypothetical protein n=1 Tax=Rhodanobacter sp. DHG33 TaxID=2775921 RepID=UPI001784D60F|nr:hypothetical protein [Rhodanobacter sp. DHG33]MBD8898374.1 hypothetical protein [Rhodanobacter sp. DHG33]